MLTPNSEVEILERLDALLEDCQSSVSHELHCVTRVLSAAACNCVKARMVELQDELQNLDIIR